jgi:hypothetical protein
MNCMAIFRTPISGILAVYIPIECKPSFIQDNIHFRKPIDTDTQNYLQYQLLPFQSTAKICTAFILHGHCFKSFVSLSDEDFDTPTSVKKIFP